jgi:ankyrin repeat protein
LESLHEQVLSAIREDDARAVERLLQSRLDLNTPDEQGAPTLYLAILGGNLSVIKMLLAHGADPNFVADEPAATIYAEKPLELAMQARFLLGWDKFEPVVELLKEYGATDSEGNSESVDALRVAEHRAKEWQSR